MMSGMAFEMALEQRYNLVLNEIERRKAYYEQMDSLKFMRLLIWQFAVFFLVVMAFGIYMRAKYHKKKTTKRNCGKCILKNGYKETESQLQLLEDRCSKETSMNKQEANFDKFVHGYLKNNGRFEEIANYSTSSSEDDDEDDLTINLQSYDDEKSLMHTLKKSRKKSSEDLSKTESILQLNSMKKQIKKAR